MAYGGLRDIYEWLEEDNSRAAKGNDRQIDFQGAINRFNEDAHKFTEMHEVSLDSDPNDTNSIAQSMVTHRERRHGERQKGGLF